MNPFSTAINLCGFSTHAEAAEFFDIRIDTLKSWRTGRRNPPDSVWHMLSDLYEQIIEVSEDALDTFDLDDMTAESFQVIAKDRYGDQLPEPALSAAIAMAVLARVTDQLP